MRNVLAAAALTVFSCAALTAPLWAEMAGDLDITKTMLRATTPGAPVAGGYLLIENDGAADDTLLGAVINTDIVGQIELHQMLMADGVMSMSQVDGGIVVPAGEAVFLQPGGLHLMLMGLTGPLVPGEQHDVTLTFERAGEITLSFPVLTLGEIRATIEEAGTMDTSGHGAGHDTADHSGQGN